MERRIERTDNDGESVHRLEQAGEIGALHREKFQERFAAGLLVTRENHGLHVWNTVRGEEHVFGTAEANALGAEAAGGLRVAWNIGVGAYAERTAEFIGPAHERREDA